MVEMFRGDLLMLLAATVAAAAGFNLMFHAIELIRGCRVRSLPAAFLNCKILLAKYSLSGGPFSFQLNGLVHFAQFNIP